MIMRRVYTDVSAFRAPFRSPNISFAGVDGLGTLGSHAAYDRNHWPTRRSYFDVSQYRQPYANGYYQSGALRGMDPLVSSAITFGVIAAVVLPLMFYVLHKEAEEDRREGYR